MVALTAPQMLALIESVERFEQLSGLRAAEGFGELMSAGSGEVSPAFVERLRASTAPNIWEDGLVAVHRGTGLVIGSAGFKGAPDAAGTVEIAYGVLPSRQGQGYATEMAAALVALASKTAPIARVIAHTADPENASTRVLEKCGFACTGSVMDEEDGQVWRWEKLVAPLRTP